MVVKEADFPCLYFDSNSASLSSQKRYKGLIWIMILLMFSSVILGSINEKIIPVNLHVNKLNGTLLLVASVISTIMLLMRPESKWYIGRAVAESIKTLTWRYMMRSEPFEATNSKEIFIQRCGEIRKATLDSDNFNPSCKSFHDDLITETMDYIRSLSFLERKEYYTKFRIEDQIAWYGKKSIFNKKRANAYGTILAVSQLFGALYLIFLADEINQINLSEALVFIASTCITVIELNKFKDLEKSYRLTEYELNEIRNRVGYIGIESDLNKFVEDAEQAISREHTMWLARRTAFEYHY